MSKLNTSAYPALDKLNPAATKGLSKRQYACIELLLPETDNDELDTLIEKARRVKFATELYAQNVCYTPDMSMKKAHEFFDTINDLGDS